MTLVGVPGIGKSRLVSELGRVVDEDDELITWRQGRCLPYGDGVSYWALGEIVKAHAGILESDPADETESKLRSVLEAIADEAERAWVERHLRPLVGLGRVDVRGDERGEAFAAWRRFLETVAESGPMVLVFEDLHWADDGLLDFVDVLVDWVDGVPLLVVCTARPELLERRPGWGGGKRNATTVSLAALDDDATARLVLALLGRPVLDAETQQALVERAAGNPLYAEEFVRMRQAGAAVDERLPDVGAGDHRGAHRPSSRDGEGSAANGRRARKGLLVGRARLCRRHRVVAAQRAPSLARAEGVRPARAPLGRRRRDHSTPSSTRSSATRRTTSFLAPRVPSVTSRRPSGSSRFRTTAPRTGPRRSRTTT